MSTQKKESSPVKGQTQNTAGAKNSAAQRTPSDAPAQKGRAPEEQRKSESNLSDRKATNERETDDKRPATTNKKH